MWWWLMIQDVVEWRRWRRDHSGTSLETTWPGFAQGASALVWFYGEALFLAVSHPLMVT
jgi:hypothetical protein